MCIKGEAETATDSEESAKTLISLILLASTQHHAPGPTELLYLRTNWLVLADVQGSRTPACVRVV